MSGTIARNPIGSVGKTYFQSAPAPIPPWSSSSGSPSPRASYEIWQPLMSAIMKRAAVSSTAARCLRSSDWLPLLDVLAHQLGHLEHVDLRLAAELRLQRVVGFDHPFVLLVLQLVLLDVRPQLLGQLGARERLRADDLRQRGIRRDGLHEGRIGFPLARRFLRHVVSLVRDARRGAALVVRVGSIMNSFPSEYQRHFRRSSRSRGRPAGRRAADSGTPRTG